MYVLISLTRSFLRKICRDLVDLAGPSPQPSRSRATPPSTTSASPSSAPRRSFVIFSSHFLLTDLFCLNLINLVWQVTTCTPNPLNCGGTGGCRGSIPQLGYNYVQLFGLVSNADYPYLSGVTGQYITVHSGNVGVKNNERYINFSLPGTKDGPSKLTTVQ